MRRCPMWLSEMGGDGSIEIRDGRSDLPRTRLCLDERTVGNDGGLEGDSLTFGMLDVGCQMLFSRFVSKSPARFIKHGSGQTS